MSDFVFHFQAPRTRDKRETSIQMSGEFGREMALDYATSEAEEILKSTYVVQIKRRSRES
jgi:hypothetical protein